MRRPLPRVSRDTILFISGLAGIGWETIHGLERPTFLVLFGAMVGLPAFLRVDEAHQKTAIDPPPPPVDPDPSLPKQREG